MVKHLVKAWKAVLPENGPCGEDVSFSPEFEALRNEVEKSTSLHATEGPDWDAVRNMATEILSTRSKDLWAMAYAIHATCQLDGLADCAETLACLNEFLGKYWDNLHPPAQRLQRRIAPLQWLQARLQHASGGTGLSVEKPEHVALLKAQLERLQKLLEAKAGDLAPAFMGIFSNITVTPEAAAEREAETRAGEAAAARAQGASPVLHAALAGMDADGRVPPTVLPQLVRNVMDQARQLAGHFLSLDMRDERAYQLHRTALWSTLLHLPPADNAGLTQMPCGVPREKAQAYASAIENKQFENALPRLERSAAKAPYWLEGHYMVARCLEALKATAAHNCVKNALAQLLGRFPELLTYKFKDGEPFAPARIVPWLEACNRGSPRASPRCRRRAARPPLKTAKRKRACKRPSPSVSRKNFMPGCAIWATSRRGATAPPYCMACCRPATAWPRARNPLPSACCRPCTGNWNNGICWIGNRNSPRGSLPCCLRPRPSRAARKPRK